MHTWSSEPHWTPAVPASPAWIRRESTVGSGFGRTFSFIGPAAKAVAGRKIPPAEGRYMRWMLIGVLGAVAAVVGLAAQANNPNPKPTCNMCPGYYIPLSELQAYTKKAVAENLVDQQVRDIEIGKAHIGIGMVHRGKLPHPAKDSVAEHDLVSEVYHIIDGTATLMLGPEHTNMVRRPATQETVRLFNGPGNNGS